jgi:hypothetical protein
MKLIFVFVLLIPLCILSQEDDPVYYVQIEPKHSYTIDYGLPVTVANRAFKGVMQGFMRGSASYQFQLKNGLGIGAGGNFTYFQINRFKISPQLIGGMSQSFVYGKFLMEKYFNERIGLDGGVKTGYSWLRFHSDSLLIPKKAESIVIEPYLSFCLSASEKTAYKWTLTYAFMGRSFNPTDIGDFVNKDYAESEYSRITRYLSFGFSFTHYFSKW